MKINVNYIPDGQNQFPIDGESDNHEISADLGFYVSTGEKDARRDLHLPSAYVREITGVLILGDTIYVGVRKRKI